MPARVHVALSHAGTGTPKPLCASRIEARNLASACTRNSGGKSRRMMPIATSSGTRPRPGSSDASRATSQSSSLRLVGRRGAAPSRKSLRLDLASGTSAATRPRPRRATREATAARRPSVPMTGLSLTGGDARESRECGVQVVQLCLCYTRKLRRIHQGGKRIQARIHARVRRKRRRTYRCFFWGNWVVARTISRRRRTWAR